jgi:hypothetical protein
MAKNLGVLLRTKELLNLGQNTEILHVQQHPDFKVI